MIDAAAPQEKILEVGADPAVQIHCTVLACSLNSAPDPDAEEHFPQALQNWLPHQEPGTTPEVISVDRNQTPTSKMVVGVSQSAVFCRFKETGSHQPRSPATGRTVVN